MHKDLLLAKIVITEVEPKSSALYDYMFLPDTNRAAYKKLELTPNQIKQLIAINTDSGMTLNIFQDEANKKKLDEQGQLVIVPEEAEVVRRMGIVSKEEFAAVQAEFERRGNMRGYSKTGKSNW